MVSRPVCQGILSHFASLDFWRPHWSQAAVVVAGSAAVGWEDEVSDTDVLVLVPQEAYQPVYERYRQATAEARVAVMNPRALQFDEFPYTYIPGTNAHYLLHRFEEIEEQVARYDDVAMWVHSSSIVLHDPSERYACLQQAASSYPEEVWREKVRQCTITMINAGGAASNPLRRGDHRTVMLTYVDAVMQALRLCCLLERKPFPYEKWLHRAAAETEPGRAALPLIDALLDELSHPDIRRVEPAAYSDHRNADLERLPLYLLWRQVRACLEGWPR